MSKRKIYLASSWRNKLQPMLVQMLRDAGHEVYDFRNPEPGDHGFSWSEIDAKWFSWTPTEFQRVLGNGVRMFAHPIARRGFGLDKAGLDWCDTCVCLLPCGRSAHLEAGYAAGQGKETFFFLNEEGFEPELMYLLGNGVFSDWDSLRERLEVAA